MPGIQLPDLPLTDGEVLLRPLREGDLAAMVAAFRDPDISRWTRIPSTYTEEDARRWLEAQPGRLARGEGVSFVVADPASDGLLGSVGLVYIDWEQLRAEVGYWVAPWARRRGVATRAVRLTSDWALVTLGLARLELIILPDNLPSRRVAERAGYTREGTLRSYVEVQGRRSDVLIYSRLWSDPDPGGGRGGPRGGGARPAQNRPDG